MRSRQALSMLCMMFLALLVMASIAPNVQATATHTVNISGSMQVPYHQYVNINLTVESGVTVHFNLTANHATDVWYKPLNYDTVLIKDSFTTLYQGTFVANYTGLHQLRFWTGAWGMNPAYAVVNYSIYYSASNTGNTFDLVTVNGLAPYTSIIAQFPGTTAGTYYCVAGTQIDGFISTWTLPPEGQEVNWSATWTLYDGSDYRAGGVNANLLADGYSSTNVGMYMTVGYGSPTWHQRFTLTTAIGHTYYLNVDIIARNSTTGAYVAHLGTTLMITESTPFVSGASDWINGIIWVMIFFIPAWLLNWVMPRYGLLMGMTLMSMVLGFTQTGGVWVSFVAFITIGTMLVTMRSD